MKRFFLLLSLVLVMMVTQVAFAQSSRDYTKEADLLKEMGLFSGTNDGYELERAPSRVGLKAP